MRCEGYAALVVGTFNIRVRKKRNILHRYYLGIILLHSRYVLRVDITCSTGYYVLVEYDSFRLKIHFMLKNLLLIYVYNLLRKSIHCF